MRPASSFLFIQLSNARLHTRALQSLFLNDGGGASEDGTPFRELCKIFLHASALP